MKLFNALARRAGVVAVVAAPLVSNAAVDLSSITGAVTDIGTVGGAVFGVCVAIALTKWVRRAL